MESEDSYVVIVVDTRTGEPHRDLKTSDADDAHERADAINRAEHLRAWVVGLRP